MLYNPTKSVWLNPNIEYLFNQEICEWDAKDAGFNIIKEFKLLPVEKIRELERLGKGIERHIEIGKLQRDDKELSKALMDKFAEVRAVFISTNKLDDNSILSVKKDAIFTIGNVITRKKFGLVEFVPKNSYSSYIRFSNINNMELYYNSIDIDIKGMADPAINSHRLFMYKFLHDIIGMIEENNPRVKKKLIDFINQYKAGSLEDEYYLKFDNRSSEIDPLFNYNNILIPLVQIIIREVQ